MFSDKTLNKDNTQSGYFGHQGRVKAVKLRGEPSEGFIMTIEDFENALHFRIDSLPENVEFDTFNETWVCRKYVPAEPRNSGTGPKPKHRISDILVNPFPFHYDTTKLSDNPHHFANEDDIITITYKMHGTSAVYSNLLTKRKLSLWERLKKFFGYFVKEHEYADSYSSRNVVKYISNRYRTQPEGHYQDDVWGKVFLKEVMWALDPGLTIYGEIVGYISHDRMIQKRYDYGCEPGECAFYVYRITDTAQDGNTYEYLWDDIKLFCQRHELQHVPELYHGTIKDYLTEYGPLYAESMTEQDNKLLHTMKSQYLEKKCHMCKNDVPAEGVVIRNESTTSRRAYKLKSFAFLKKESDDLDNGEVDIETQESDAN